tara:strand:- start:4385 stop:5086 length:702 start_codon:yes stop_codon:yes gene_type:complete
MINSLIPFRLGDIVKIYLAKRNLGITVSKLTSTVIIGHYFDFLFLFVFLNIIFFLVNIDISDVFQWDVVYYVLFLINLIITLSLIYIKQVTKFFDFIFFRISYLNKYRYIIKNLNYDVNLLTRNMYKLTLTLFLTFAYWGSLILIFKFVSIGIGLDLNVQMLILAVVLSSFAISIPVTPTSLGTFHLAIVYSLSFLIENQTLLFAYSLILHTIIIVSIISCGSVSFLWMQLKK